MVNLRARDLAPPDPPASKSDIARLAGSIPKIDLSAVAGELAELRAEIATLKHTVTLLAAKPEGKGAYTFDIIKDAGGVISSVTARPAVNSSPRAQKIN
jgi:hypothetical protein